MTSSRSRALDWGGVPPCILSTATTIRGDCISDGPIRIEGTVEGHVVSSDVVVVTRQGTVRGGIEAREAIIAGTVEGGVRVLERLELQSTAQVGGDARAPRLQLEEGARLMGQVTILPTSASIPLERHVGGLEESRNPHPKPLS